MTLVRALVPPLIALLLVAVSVWTLLQRPPNVWDRPVAPNGPETAIVPIDLGAVRLSDGTRLAQLGVRTKAPGFLLSHDRVLLLITTFETRPRLIHGLLRVEGAPCVFETPTGAALRNNAYVVFERDPACRIPVGEMLPGRVDVTVRFDGPGRIGIVASPMMPERVPSESLTLAAYNAAGPAGVPVVRARYGYPLDGEPLRRVDLLAAMWNLPGGVGLIWALLAVAWLLMGGGAAILVSGRGAAGWRSVSVRAAASAVAAIGLALCYVVLVPPLHGPDEPDHLLAFADSVGRPELRTQTEDLARVGHFDRIHRSGEEQFRTGDVGHPLPVTWDPRDVFAHDITRRSVTTWAWWQMVGPFSRPFDAAGTLLLIRVANALLFGLAVALAFLLLTWTSEARPAAVQPVVLALLLVPALPFFAIHVSEFAVLTAVYIVLAGIVAALFLDGHRAYALGLPLGLAISLVLASGRSALPLVPALLAIAAGRAVVGSRHHSSSKAATRVFWGGFAVGLLVFPFVSTQAFRMGLWPDDTGHVPSTIRPYAEYLRHHPFVLVLFAPVGFAVERVMVWFRRRVGRRWVTWGTLGLRALCLLTAAAIVGTLTWSLVTRFPVLATLETARPASATRYVTEVLVVALTGLRLWNHDFLLSTSFWGGFGWVDTIPPVWFISLVVLLHALVGVVLLIRLACADEWRRPAWLGILAAGWTTALGLYAVASYILDRNVHGRYLVGLYLIALAVAWCAASLGTAGRPPWARVEPARIARFMLITAACLHAFAFHVILTRYF